MTQDSQPEQLVLYLVDDDASTRAELVRILDRHTALKVVPFEAPSRVLDSLDREPPDLALIDLRLPQMDGLSLLEKIRDRAPDVMPILMTGYGEAETARRAREGGALDFVEKPLDLPYLLVVLRQLEREARLRKNLRAGGVLFSKVIEMMPDGIVMTDLAGQVLFANSLGKALYGEGEDEAGARRRYAGRVYVLERNESGDRALWHWIDLTAALERERIAAYKQMSRHLAHEIRNPLTPMRLWLQELQSLNADDPNYRAFAGKAVAVLTGQIDRLLAVLDHFKTLGDEDGLELEPVEVLPVIRDVVRALAPYAEQLAMRVAMPEDGDLVAQGDENSLYQCVFNAVRNALEAGRNTGGVVRIEAEETPDNVAICIVDEAGGLPPEVAAAPFTPYLTTKAEGTGLGLLVCRDLAARMGAKLELEDRPGVGVTVRLVLKKP